MIQAELATKLKWNFHIIVNTVLCRAYGRMGGLGGPFGLGLKQKTFKFQKIPVMRSSSSKGHIL